MSESSFTCPGLRESGLVQTFNTNFSWNTAKVGIKHQSIKSNFKPYKTGLKKSSTSFKLKSRDFSKCQMTYGRDEIVTKEFM